MRKYVLIIILILCSFFKTFSQISVPDGTFFDTSLTLEERYLIWEINLIQAKLPPDALILIVYGNGWTLVELNNLLFLYHYDETDNNYTESITIIGKKEEYLWLLKN